MVVTDFTLPFISAESKESDASFRLCGRTLGRSDEEVLALANMLAEQRAQKKKQEVTKVEYGARPLSPQVFVRRLRQGDIPTSPRTPRPPSLSAVSASIQSELKNCGELGNDINTLDKFWKTKNAEQIEGLESFRIVAGSLDYDPIFHENRLPATHVEAWLSVVLRRADTLDILHQEVDVLRKSLGLPSAPCRQDGHDRPRTDRRGALRGQQGREFVKDIDPASPPQAEPRSFGLQWLVDEASKKKQAKRMSKIETNGGRLTDVNILRAYDADCLAQLALDRETLTALGLDQQTIDQTYRALYVHSVGAHMLVRRACGCCKLPQNRGALSAALWIMFMYLVEGTEDVQYKSAVTRARMAGIANVEEAKDLMKSELASNRCARDAAAAQLRAANACCEAFAADIAHERLVQELLTQEREGDCAHVVAESSAQFLKLLERSNMHKAHGMQVQVSLEKCEKSLQTSEALLEKTRATASKTRGELDFVKHQRQDFERKYESAEIERQTLAAKLFDTEAQLQAAVNECRSLHQELHRTKSQRQVAESNYALIKSDINRISKSFRNLSASCRLEFEKDEEARQYSRLSPIPDAAICFSANIEGKHETSSALMRQIKEYQDELLKLRDSKQQRAVPETVDVALSPIGSIVTESSLPFSRQRRAVRGEQGLLVHHHNGTESDSTNIIRERETSVLRRNLRVISSSSVSTVFGFPDKVQEDKLARVAKPGESVGKNGLQVIEDLTCTGDTAFDDGGDESLAIGFGEANEYMWEPTFNVTLDELSKIAAKETAAKLTSDCWMRAYTKSLRSERKSKLRIDELSDRLRVAENEALPASNAAFSAEYARGQSLKEEHRLALQSLEVVTKARNEAEERAHLAEAASAEIGELISLRTRNAVLQKASVILGGQLEQARDVARNAHRRELETQQTANDLSSKLTEMKRFENERLENEKKREREMQAAMKSRVDGLQEQNAALSEELENMAKRDLAKTKAREAASAKLLNHILLKANKLLSAHSSTCKVEAEDWRGRYSSEKIEMCCNHVSTVAAKDNHQNTKKKPWPKNVIVVGGINSADNTEIVCPPVDLDTSCRALRTSLAYFLDQERIDHARVGACAATICAPICTIVCSAPAREERSSTMLPSTVEASRKRNIFIDADCQECTGFEVIDSDEDCANLTMTAMVAAATLRRLDRELSLARSEAASSSESRDSMNRQLSECVTRYGDLSNRCEDLVSALEHSKQAHKIEIDGKDEHRRKLVASARRLKEESDADVAELTDLLALTTEREESTRKKLSLTSEIAQMAVADSESRELRRWEIAFLSDVSSTAEEAIDAAMGLSRAVNEAGPYAARVDEVLSRKMQDSENFRASKDSVSNFSSELQIDCEDDDSASISSASSRLILRKTPQRKRFTPQPRRPPKPAEKWKSRRRKSFAKQRVSQYDDKTQSFEEEERIKIEEDAAAATSGPDEWNVPRERLGNGSSPDDSRQWAMTKKIERATNEMWLRERCNAGLTQLWLSSQQHALVQLRETCGRLTGLFEAVRSRYILAQTREKKLSGALDRIGVAYDQLRKEYLEQLQREKARELEDGKEDNSEIGDSAPTTGADPESFLGKSSGSSKKRQSRKQLPRVDFGHDETTQTYMKLLCCRQIQTEHSWVHGCLKNQKVVQVSRSTSAERTTWADSSPVVLATNGRLMRMEDFHCELFREPEDNPIHLVAKPKSILDELLQQDGFSSWTQGRDSSSNILSTGSTKERDCENNTKGTPVESNNSKGVSSLIVAEENTGNSKVSQNFAGSYAGSEDEEREEDKLKSTGKLSTLKEASEMLRSGMGASLHNLLMPNEEFAAEDVATHQRSQSKQQHEYGHESILDTLELPPDVHIPDGHAHLELVTQVERAAVEEAKMELSHDAFYKTAEVSTKIEIDEHLSPEIQRAMDLIIEYRAKIEPTDAVEGVSDNESKTSLTRLEQFSKTVALLADIRSRKNSIGFENPLAAETGKSKMKSAIESETSSSKDPLPAEKDEKISTSCALSESVSETVFQTPSTPDDEINATRDVMATDTSSHNDEIDMMDAKDFEEKHVEADNTIVSTDEGARYLKRNEEKQDAGKGGNDLLRAESWGTGEPISLNKNEPPVAEVHQSDAQIQDERILLAKQLEMESDALRRVHEEHNQQEAPQEEQTRGKMSIQYRVSRVNNSN